MWLKTGNALSIAEWFADKESISTLIASDRNFFWFTAASNSTQQVLRCIAEGVATRDGCARMIHFAQVNSKNKEADMYARRPTGCVWDSQFLIPKSK